MSDSQLSQEELDALLQGTPIQGGTESFAAAEESTLGKLCQALGEARVPQLAGLTGKAVSLSQSSFISGTPAKLGEDISGSVIGAKNNIGGTVSGDWISFAPESTIISVAGSMLGIEAPGEVSEEMIGAFGEALSNGFASDIKILSEQLKSAVSQTADTAARYNSAAELLPTAGTLVRLTFTYQVGDGLAPFHVVMPMKTAKDLAKALLPTATPAAAPASSNTVPMQMAQFQQFGTPQPVEAVDNLALLLDVPMRVTVELGRTRMTIKDILNLGAGSIVELEKLAGEPVDVLVNDKLIALGEVVVIDENFSIRVTKVVTPMERIFDRENLHGKGGV